MKNEQPAANAGGFYVTIATAAGSTTKKVEGDSLTVGRADCDLTILHETLSRLHLTITLKDGAFWIEDHASSNGTFVNGKRVQTHTLVKILPDDDLSLGQSGVQLRLSLEPTPVASHESSAAAPVPEPAVSNVVQSHSERVFQEAQKNAAAIIQEAEIEAERRVEDIYKRAHETQAKMDEVYQKRMNDAYRAAEQIYHKSQEESRKSLEAGRLRLNEIRLQSEKFLMELRKRTEGDCERLLAEAQQTSRQLKEQHQQELIAQNKQVLQERLARFEEELALRAKTQRDEMAKELDARQQQWELDHRAQTEALIEIKDQVQQLRDLYAIEKNLLREAEQTHSKQSHDVHQLKVELESNRKVHSDLSQQLSRLCMEIETSERERALSEVKVKEGRDHLVRMTEECRAAEKRVALTQEEVESKLLQLRAKFEIDKVQAQKSEQAHFEELKLQTTRKIRTLEEQLIEELHAKKDGLTRELALLVESHLQDPKTTGSHELQNLIGSHFAKHIASLSKENGAQLKQASLIELKRRQKIMTIAIGMAAGALVMFGGERAVQHLQTEASPMQRKVVTAQEERKAELELRKFNPAQTREFKATYVDNVIYTENFVATYSGDDFQKKFMQALSPYMLKTWKVDEDIVIQLLGISTTLVKSLAEKKINIHPDFIQRGLDKMRESEAEGLTRMRNLLGTEVRLESFKKFEQQFYETYKPEAEATIRSPSADPPIEP